MNSNNENKQVLVPRPNMGPKDQKRSLQEIFGLIGQAYKPRAVERIFDKPEEYIKEVENGWGYAWPKYDAALKAKIRKEQYILVDPEEIRDDCALAIEARIVDIGAVDENGRPIKSEIIQMGDLVLVKIPPTIYNELYKSRAIEAYINSIGGLTHDNLENSAGFAPLQGVTSGLNDKGSVVTQIELSQTQEL